MFRLAAACLALGFVIVGAGAPAAARDGFKGPKSVRTAGAFSSLGAGIGRPWHRPFHRFRHGRRGGVPLFLDRRGRTPVIVQVNQIAPAAAAVPAFQAIPSVADLPVRTGIRETLPAEPALYVLNDGGTFRRQPLGLGVRSAGPRIISLSDEAETWTEETGPSSGARVIHLAVPVGPRG
jgi:hypothetical protein